MIDFPASYLKKLALTFHIRIFDSSQNYSTKLAMKKYQSFASGLLAFPTVQNYRASSQRHISAIHTQSL